MVDSATRFAIALAERVSPDEVDVAPALLASERHERDERRTNKGRKGVVVGGFAGTEFFVALGILSLTFDAIKFCIETAVVGIHIGDLRAWLRGHLAEKSSFGDPAQSAAAGFKAAQFFEQLAQRMEEKGLARPDAQRNANLIRELVAEQPDAAAEFFAALGARR